MKKTAKILVIYFSLVFLGSFYFDNFTWIGWPCEPGGPGDHPRKCSYGKRQRYLTLQGCIDSQSEKYSTFICSSALDPHNRDSDVYGSFSKVYSSEDGRLIKRDTSFSFFWLPLHLIVSLVPAFLLIILWIIIYVVRRKLRTRNKSENNSVTDSH